MSIRYTGEVTPLLRVISRVTILHLGDVYTYMVLCGKSFEI